MLGWKVPELEERRNEPAARVAFYAYCLITFAIDLAQRFPCVCCGQPGPAQWCDTCELAGNRPLAGPPHFRPDLNTPMCNRCVHDNVACLVCGTRPEDGPPDHGPGVALEVDGLHITAHGWA